MRVEEVVRNERGQGRKEGEEGKKARKERGRGRRDAVEEGEGTKMDGRRAWFIYPRSPCLTLTAA